MSLTWTIDIKIDRGSYFLIIKTTHLTPDWVPGLSLTGDERDEVASIDV